MNRYAVRPVTARQLPAPSAFAQVRQRAAGAPTAAPRGVLRAKPPVAAQSDGSHPLADAALTQALGRRARAIDSAFAAIEPTLKSLALAQFEDGFAERAASRLGALLGVRLPADVLAADWDRPLDVPRLSARLVVAIFAELAAREFDRSLARLADGEDAEALIRRFGFHAIDITPCADGRLSGVVDYILRLPPAIVAYRTSCAGALFDVEQALNQWETVELRRWREGVPNTADAPTRYLKIGVYHRSSANPGTDGCAAHGSNDALAAGALLARLTQFAQAVERTHCCGASIATLLIGVDTDTDAIRVHVPDAAGRIDTGRFLDNIQLYEQTRMLGRAAAKEAIRLAVAACAGVAPDDGPTEGIRWLCAYLLKNNIGQIDAVRAWHGGAYGDGGHAERLIIVGDPIDDVQLRNVAFQSQMDTVEEGAADLEVGIGLLRHRHEPLRRAVPVLVHCTYDARVPGAEERATQRAVRLRSAIEARYAPLVAKGTLYVEAMVRPRGVAAFTAVPAVGCACDHPETAR